MSKPRKMLADINAPYIKSLMSLIETQSSATISNWCIDYAEIRLLPLWRTSYPDDIRPESALSAARDYLVGKIKLHEAKKQIFECRNAARETEGFPIGQGAARTIDSAASSIYNPASSLGLALYGALTIAYNQAGISTPWETLEMLAEAECRKMEAALLAMAVGNEPNPAKIKWNC